MLAQLLTIEAIVGGPAPITNAARLRATSANPGLALSMRCGRWGTWLCRRSTAGVDPLRALALDALLARSLALNALLSLASAGPDALDVPGERRSPTRSWRWRALETNASWRFRDCARPLRSCGWGRSCERAPGGGPLHAELASCAAASSTDSLLRCGRSMRTRPLRCGRSSPHALTVLRLAARPAVCCSRSPLRGLALAGRAPRLYPLLWRGGAVMQGRDVEIKKVLVSENLAV